MAKQPMKSNTNAPHAGGVGNVRFVRDEVRKYLPQYNLIRDCIDGEMTVKGKGDVYLPRPDPTNTTEQNRARYAQYVQRAVFYNATRRTQAGLLGEVFAIDPIVEIPSSLEPMRVDATGGGVTLIQQSIECCNNVLAYSRAGVFVDFPRTSAPISREEQERGDFHPTISIFHPWQVINWRVTPKASKLILSLVVIEEYYETQDDGFEVKKEKQWRVLRLEGGVYKVDIYKGTQAGVVGAPVTVTPLDDAGKPFDEIPFKFVGSKNNDPTIDAPLLYDLASLNMAHYRNSADNEESSFVVGQPMFWFAGLTKQWVKEVLGGRVESGSRAAVPLPERASAGILQADPNTMPKDGMEHKEKQMVALGAKLVENRSVQRTASEATMDQRTENSILSTAANNVSDVFTWALQTAAKFVGAADSEIKFKCNTEFAVDKLSPEDQQALVASWQAGAIDFTEMREGLRKSGIATKTDDEAKTSIDKEVKERDKRELSKATAIAKAQPKPVAGPKKPAAKKPAK